MDSNKITNSLKWKKDRSPEYLWDNYFFWHFLNNLSALLLCKIYVFYFFNMVDFFHIFFYIVKYWNSDRIKLLARSVYIFFKCYEIYNMFTIQFVWKLKTGLSIRKSTYFTLEMKYLNPKFYTCILKLILLILEITSLVFWKGNCHTNQCYSQCSL